MRQHPIPQNILDIEFKLFTKFTVREFVYLAVGVGFGGIFIYLYSIQELSAIIAIPIFLISSGLGIFMGLVKINDQSADVFIRNYIWAITHPTQRVWKNELIDESVEELSKPELNMNQGQIRKNGQQTGEIIGGTGMPQTQFIEQGKLLEIDEEEKKQLENITNIAQGTTPKKGLVDQNVVVQNPSSVQNKILITNQNYSAYKAEMSATPSGNMNFKVVDSSDSAIIKPIVVIKDANGNVVSAFRGNEGGEIYTGKMFPPALYNIEIQAGGYTFPKVQLLIENTGLPAIKIKSN